MKVAIISNDFRVYWKGRLAFLQPFLNKHGITMHAIELFGNGSPYAFDSYTDHYAWWQCLFPDQSADQLTKEAIAEALFLKLDNIAPDIIIASPITFFAGALGLRWAKARQKKFIMFDDAKPLKQFKRNLVVQWVRNTITRQADALWLPASEYDDEYPALRGWDVDFFYGFNCINNKLFKPAHPNPLNHHNIACVARLVPVKNIDGLLKAWQIVEAKNNSYQLTIIGDGPLKNSLAVLAATLGLTRVTFAGAVSNDGLPGYYNKADAFVLPSLSETWGLVVNEAMAAGLPVLLSDKVNAAQSLLVVGKNGFSFDPFNFAEIADSILKFIELEEAGKQQMAAQSLTIVNAMDYENMGEELLNALNSINAKPFKKPGLIANAIIKRWFGKHDTIAWDKLN